MGWYLLLLEGGHLGYAGWAALLTNCHLPGALACVCLVGGAAKFRRLKVINLGVLQMPLSSSVRYVVGVLVLTEHGLQGSLAATTEVSRIGLFVLLHRRSQQVLISAQVVRTSSH
jgi:hypothetical protein